MDLSRTAATKTSLSLLRDHLRNLQNNVKQAIVPMDGGAYMSCEADFACHLYYSTAGLICRIP